ncbi:MAG: leucine-rich repeat protein [Aristaeellaceae bacterium]
MKKQYRWLTMLCLALCLLTLWGVAAAQEEPLQQEQWLYRLTEDGTAEILGYADASAEQLTIPTQLGGAYVTAIGDNAFAEHAALRELTVPVQVARISDSAFPQEDAPVIRTRNGSQALRYARSHGMTVRNLSTFDFFAEVLDLSEMDASAWSVQGGTLRLAQPYAGLVSAGDKVYLPARGDWSQGMPVRLDTLTYEDGTAVAACTILSLPEALQSYHAEDVPLYLDLDAMELGEGVTLAPVSRGAATAEMGYQSSFKFEKSYSNGVTVKGDATIGLSVTGSVDYEWLEISSVSLTTKETGSITGNVSYDGSEDQSSSLTRSFLLFRAPLVSEGVLSAWTDVYVNLSLNGEATFTMSVGAEQQLSVTEDNVLTRKNVLLSPSATLQASATMRAGIENNLSLRLGFPGSYDLSLELAGISGYMGVAGRFSYTTEAPLCYTVTVDAEASAEARHIVMKKEQGSVTSQMKKVPLTSKTFQLWQKHWEGDTGRWQDECTHSDLCTVSLYTGSSDVMEPILVARGEKIGAPKAPSRDGYAFLGWYKSLNGSVLFDFSEPITQDVTLYAKWLECTPTPSPTPTATPSPTPTATPDPDATPTPTPYVPEWYPYEDIPDAAESIALCEIEARDDDYDDVIDCYYITIPNGVQAITLSKTYNGLPIEWHEGIDAQLKALAFSSEYAGVFDIYKVPSIVQSVETIYLPTGVTSIVNCQGTYHLKHIYLPDTLVTIDDHAFYYSGLVDIEIPDSVTHIGGSAFYACKYLQNVTVGNGVTDIGGFAFAYCGNLKEIILPNSLQTIGGSAFAGTGLESVVIPEGVTSIGRFAFNQCYNLREISFPGSLGTVERYDLNTSDLLEKVVLNEGITAISDYAFINCKGLKEVSMPNTLQTIGLYAFSGSALEHVELPDGTREIGDYAFYDCKNLKEMELPGTLQTIGIDAFGNAGIEHITIPEGVTSIGDYAFFACENLKEVSLPSSLQTIGEQVFTHSGIEKITIPEGVISINAEDFWGCMNLTEVSLPSTLQTIGSGAFGNCINLKKVVLNCTLQSNAFGIFSGCDNLEELYISEGVTSLPNLGLNSVPLRVLTLPSTLESITGKVNGLGTLKLLTCYATDLPEDSLQKISFTGVKAVAAYHDSTIAKYVEENFPDVQLLYLDAGDYYRVHFETQRGTQPEDVIVKAGEPIPEPETPVWSSRVFEGWCKDWHRLEPWDFETDTMPESNITLYAKWTYVITGTVITQADGRCYLKSLLDPEEALDIPEVMNGSMVVGLMADLIPPGVTTVHLSAIVEDVRPGTFRRATDLTAITVDENNPCFYAVDGVLYARDGRLICYPAGKTQGSFSVPEGVTAIVGDAFAGCSWLTNLTLPSTLTALDSAAIYDCNALERVDFAAAPTAIGEGCFTDCGSVMLYGPENATTLIDYADISGLSYNVYQLSYCSDGAILAQISLGAGEAVPDISGPTQDERILLGWTDDEYSDTPVDFTDYVMPAHDLTLYAIWGYAFDWQATEDGVQLTQYNGGETLIRVPESINGMEVTSIADEAFAGLSGFTLLGNRGSVTDAYAEAKGYAFQPLTYRLRFVTNGGTQLPDQTLCATDPVVIPECVKTGYDLEGWYLDSWLWTPWEDDVMPAQNLTLYAGWSYNGEETQYVPFSYRTEEDGICITGCTDESDYIEVPEDINGIPVVSIDEGAFAGLSGVSYVFLPDSVTSIGAYAFQGMSGLTYIQLPSGLTVLPRGALQGCSLLSSVSLPSSLERIESEALANCTSLTGIWLPASLTSLAPDAFAGSQRLRTIGSSSEHITAVDGAAYSEQGTKLLLFPPASTAVAYDVPEGVISMDEAVRFTTKLRDLYLPESLTELHAACFERCAADLVVHVPAGSAAETFFQENLPDVILNNSMYEEEPLIIGWDTDTPVVGEEMHLICLDGMTIVAMEDVLWTVDQPEIAQITQEGALTFLHAGRVTVTATLQADETRQASEQFICMAQAAVTLPVGLRELGPEALRGGGMEAVVLPEGLEQISSCAFADCRWLFSVRIPDSVTAIAEDAFTGSPYVCIFCTEGSYAQSYAQRMNLPCVTDTEP